MTDPPIGIRGMGNLAKPAPVGAESHEPRCAARHLVVAAVELARDPRLPRDRAARYAMAESRFRALTDLDGFSAVGAPNDAVPGIAIGNGTVVPLTDLLIGACRSYRIPLPRRSIDSELVFAAKELLAGLDWTFPGEPAADVPATAAPAVHACRAD